MGGSLLECSGHTTSLVCWCTLHLSASHTQGSYLANLVLEDTVERIYHRDVFAENWRGLYLIRGENVVLLGEIVRDPLGPHLHPQTFT
jgi:U6 snRNA-associated Sm-like protein LSm1